MILINKILFLKNVSLFTRMSLDELKVIAEISEEVIFSTDEPIISQGNYGTCMYLIVDGTVKIHSGDTVLATLGEKEYFGELSIIDGEPRSASVSAISDCLLLKIDNEDFHHILSMHPESAMAVMKALTRDLREARLEMNHE